MGLFISTFTLLIATSIYGIVIPLLIFIFSFVVTYLLYKHFSKQL